MENNQIDLVKSQVNKAFDTVNTIKITNIDEYSNAVEIGGKLKKVSKMLTERKEEITKPMNEALKSARALFKPMEELLEKSELELKSKMLDFKNEERRLQIEAEKKESLALEKIKNDLNESKIDSVDADIAISKTIKENTVQVTEKTVRSETGAKATEKFITEYIVADKSKIPLNFLEPDMVKIKASFKADMPVAGVEERKKAVISF
jgi:hypothetical protein